MELQVLFLTEYADSISFCTKDLPYREQVDEAITSNGGEVTDTPGHYTVYLVSKPKLGSKTSGMVPPYNTFSADYIKDCVEANILQPLKDYWVHKVLDFDDEKFDPLNVMLGNLTWEDCKKQLPMSPPRGASTVDPDDELFYDDDLLTCQPRRIHPKSRQSYTHKERVEILQYIKKKNGYNRVNGNAFWKEMDKEVCSSRTWQSMREHFRRYIIQHLEQFPSDLTDGFRHPPQQEITGCLHFGNSPECEISLSRVQFPAPPDEVVLQSVREDPYCKAVFGMNLHRQLSKYEFTKYGVCGRQALLLPNVEKDNVVCVEEDEEKNRVQDARESDISVRLLAQVEVREGAEEEEERKDGEERPDKAPQAGTQIEERTSDRRKEKIKFFNFHVETNERDKKKKENIQEIKPVPPQLRVGEGKEKGQDENEDKSICQHQNKTEEKKEKNEGKKNAQKPTSLPHTHANKEEKQERNEFETKEGEWGINSPSLLSTYSNFQGQFIPQESQGFSVTYLLPMVLEAEESNSNSSKNKMQQHQEEQQEPDSSMELLEDSEEKICSEDGTESQLNTSSNSKSNPGIPLLSSSSQLDEQVPLIVPSFSELSGVSEEMDSLHFTMDRDDSLSPEIALCDSNISLHHMRVRTSPRQTVTMEDGKGDKGNLSKRKGEETEVKERLLRKEISVSSQQMERNAKITPAKRMMNDNLSKEELNSKIALSFASSGRKKMKVQDKEEEEDVEVGEEEKEEETCEEEEDEEDEEETEENEEDCEEEPRKSRVRQQSCHPSVRQHESRC